MLQAVAGAKQQPKPWEILLTDCRINGESANALKTLFDNDASSARPDGTMEVVAVIWWEHNTKHGQYSSAVVHRSLIVLPSIQEPKRIEDYSIKLKKLEGLKPEIFNPNNIKIEGV